MKKSIFYLVLFLFISISSYCQDISSINFEFHCSACKRNSDITIRIPDGTYTAVKDSVLIRIDSIPVYVKSESIKFYSSQNYTGKKSSKRFAKFHP